MLKRFLRGVQRVVWRISAPQIVLVRATPLMCLKTVVVGAKPSTERLHLRDVFADGRRYMVQQKENGFAITTTSILPRYYRRRTRSCAVLTGTFTPVDDQITRVELNAHIKLTSALEALLIPAGIASIIVYVPWHPLTIAGLLALLLALSWTDQRTAAALEAHEMTYFVQKTLADLAPAEILSLSSKTIDITYIAQDFEAEWQRFYETHHEAEMNNSGKD